MGFGIHDSFCQLEIYLTDKDHNVVIATERKDNPGTSITNALPDLAIEVYNGFYLNPLTTIWIECYKYDESEYSLAHFTVDNKGNILDKTPVWTHLTEEQVNEYIKGL